MRAGRMVIASLALVFVASCGGGGSGGSSGAFGLIQFLEAGQNNIPRNRVLTFRFSSAVSPDQDLFERLKIQNVQTTGGLSDFSKANGNYVISAEIVFFFPRLPEKDDRTDSGFREKGNYHVFLKGGPDALRAVSGDAVSLGQEFLFDTNNFFEDPEPTQPPRVSVMTARDESTQAGTDISRLDPRPNVLAQISSADLHTAGRVIDPGAGPPPYDIRWQFELHVSEPLDPQSVTEKNIEMFQVAKNSINGIETAVNFRVPITVKMIHTMDAQGNVTPFIRVTMVQTLVDNARYRVIFSGNILGIDFRKQFTGENGLTGDGQTPIAQLAQGNVLEEPGGLGYVTEFLVEDRPQIAASRTVQYNPGLDGIEPEAGQTTTDETLFNSALYNPVEDPNKAIGFLSAFGDGSDGDFAASGSGITDLDTGDVANEVLDTLTITNDPDPTDAYSNNGSPPTGAIDYDIVEPTEFKFSSLTVSSSAVLRIIGVNACRIRVTGIVSITGRIDASGGNGQAASGSNRVGGAGGAGGFAGGDSKRGNQSCTLTSGMSCTTLDSWLNRCAGAKNNFPYALKGGGPGRGNGGGGTYPYHATTNSGLSGGLSGTGGGGGSHAKKGTDGDDKYNVSGAKGTAGTACAVNWNTPKSNVIGVRGVAGPAYGDAQGLVVLIGGSGGGGGGPVHAHQFANGASAISGGSGGGGGGWLEIVASSSILLAGTIDASGGDGGKGFLQLNTARQGWDIVSGSGGGGAGGTIHLISGANINLTAGVIDVRGGAGGVKPGTGTTTSCNFCNKGGDGGPGFLLLMDSDGRVDGYIPNAPATYPDHAFGYLTISNFDANRFSSIRAVTELFPMPAADPKYTPILAGDVLGVVHPGQSIEVWASSSKADPDDPLAPDLSPGSENPPIHVATIAFQGGGVVIVIENPIEGLNPGAAPNREAFVRIRSDFNYTDAVEAALGPFATMDEMTVRCIFNG